MKSLQEICEFLQGIVDSENDKFNKPDFDFDKLNDLDEDEIELLLKIIEAIHDID